MPATKFFHNPAAAGFFITGMAGKLTPKEDKFVDEYLVDLNGAQAAIRAGFSKKTARQAAARLLTKVNISEALAARRAKLSEATGISQQRVLNEYAKIGFFDIRKAFDSEGNLKAIHELDDDTAAAISGIEVEVRLIAGEADEEQEPQAHGGSLKRQHGTRARLHKIRLTDKKGALDSIARHLGMFNDSLLLKGRLALTHEQLLEELDNDPPRKGVTPQATR